MAGLIPQTFIDDLLDRIDIVDVVDSRVKLKKSGKNYSACCPFHDEKTPSFTVSPDKQFYYCFGCGASGTALGFILEYDRLSFPDGVEELAKMAGLEVPRETRSESPQYLAQQQLRKDLYQILERADQHYRQQLRSSPARQHAINYLQKRGLSGEIARDFGLGYAPPGWDNLLQALGQTEAEKKLLTEGGLLIERPEDRRRYDRFRNRIMFPILDIRGRVIGFGGRVLDDSKPKYLNSPETPVFHKGRELYGLYQARQAHSQLPRLLVVEGYMDVVALAQFGIRYGVATLGTATGEEHLNLAFKYTQEIVFCFDGDNAGRKAATRALENSLPAMQDGRQIKFLFLPDGEDPDTLIRQVGAEKFSRMVESAVPLEEFLFDSVADGIAIQSMEGRARLSKRAAPLLHKLPAGVFRELMFANLAQRTGLPVDTLHELVDNTEEVITHKPENPQPERRDRVENPKEIDTSSTPWDDDYTAPPQFEDNDTVIPAAVQPAKLQRYNGPIKLPPAKRLSAILLHHPELAATTPDTSLLENSSNADLCLFLELLALLRSRPNYSLPRILGHWRGKKGAEATNQLAELAATELLNHARQQSPFDAASEYHDCLKSLQQQFNQANQKQQLQALNRKKFSELSEQEKQQIRELHLRQPNKPG